MLNNRRVEFALDHGDCVTYGAGSIELKVEVGAHRLLFSEAGGLKHCVGGWHRFHC
jgi:hypothetical protein